MLIHITLWNRITRLLGASLFRYLVTSQRPPDEPAHTASRPRLRETRSEWAPNLPSHRKRTAQIRLGNSDEKLLYFNDILSTIASVVKVLEAGGAGMSYSENYDAVRPSAFPRKRWATPAQMLLMLADLNPNIFCWFTSDETFSKHIVKFLKEQNYFNMQHIHNIIHKILTMISITLKIVIGHCDCVLWVRGLVPLHPPTATVQRGTQVHAANSSGRFSLQQTSQLHLGQKSS